MSLLKSCFASWQKQTMILSNGITDLLMILHHRGRTGRNVDKIRVFCRGGGRKSITKNHYCNAALFIPAQMFEIL